MCKFCTLVVLITSKGILKTSGSVSHQQALDKAHEEYNKYKRKVKNELSQVEHDFLKQIDDSYSKTKKIKK